MKLKGKIVLFTTLVCIISILSISAINFKVAIGRLEREINEKSQFMVDGIAKDIDKWMALQKDSLYETMEGLIFTNNYEYDFVQGYLGEAIKRNPGNEYFIAFSDKSLISGSGWVPDSDYDPTSRE